MDSGMIGKIEKAKRYAKQRERFHFKSLTVDIDGENNPHTVSLENGAWQCNCDFFKSRGACAHTFALEELLKDMLPETLFQD
ncbi:MAG: hypothetical protein L0Z70_05485 [Chloroflexi bacterium]|nr:hypothetical protein [Chloroflexota bacterium]